MASWNTKQYKQMPSRIFSEDDELATSAVDGPWLEVVGSSLELEVVTLDAITAVVTGTHAIAGRNIAKLYF